MDDQELFTLPQAATYLGTTTATLRVDVHRGVVVARKLGRDWVITGAELDRQLAKRGKPARSEQGGSR